ncbi:hypothetical protein BaRGS_00010303 [Batillaria attramentaria]|uniref:Uncharacterized protein n=1 Tax=Batillaria attramentaria TaxID=370345 RepID=A0ABD0LFV2_9CAEN
MSVRQQAMINVLSKYCSKYFLYKRTTNKEDAKVRLRSSVHRVEQAPEDYRTVRVKHKLNNEIEGFFTPNYVTFRPAGGCWPTTAIDELVLTAMSDQLDPMAWTAVRNHFDLGDVERMPLPKAGELKRSDLSQCADAGFNRIKSQIKESELRIPYMSAGKSFCDHFLKTQKEQERKMREAAKEDVCRDYEHEQVILVKERVRRDDIKYLETVIDLINTLLLIKTRHLKSIEPIRLEILGTDRDKEEHHFKRTPHRLYGYIPKSNVFKEQILMHAPHGWNTHTTDSSASINVKGLRTSIGPPKDGRSRADRKLFHSLGRSQAKLSGVQRRHVPAENQPVTDETDKESGSVKNVNIYELYRKPWPPLWLSLAAAEQGDTSDILPQIHKSVAAVHTKPQQQKTIAHIQKTRRKWAKMRQRLDRTVEQTMERADDERLEFFKLRFNTLDHIPTLQTLQHQLGRMDATTGSSRKQRQAEFLYDCELTGWYKELANELWDEYGRTDEDINAILFALKEHVNLSPTNPRLGKAKMALIVMSMPATVVCHIHVQRAIQFLLHNIMQAPPETLSLWLSTRGLPYVLIETDPDP